MSRAYRMMAFTDPVLEAQVRYGSRAALARSDHHPAVTAAPPPAAGRGAATDPSANVRDPMGAGEREFIGAQDGFYLATVGSNGWPYVQFRGGPSGFVTCPDEHTVAWADFRGNRQYISIGNLTHDARVAMIFLDYAHQVRLKVFGLVTITDVNPTERLPVTEPLHGYRAIVERQVRVEVKAFDWNCPQHITPRYTAEEVASVLEPLRRRAATADRLAVENQELREQIAALSSEDDS
jgi:predicted pyridoxine 5'-phosphate oxidase superfamily flavin-nucleotide-binding protein